MAKILVIEDDRGIRNLLEALLSHKGYRVLLAENGEKGFELLRQARPDVILLDLKMPEMDGLTVLPSPSSSIQGSGLRRRRSMSVPLGLPRPSQKIARGKTWRKP
jgi:CheY-like chemotaxis protein